MINQHIKNTYECQGGMTYLDLARIFLLLRFSLRILFLRHYNKNLKKNGSSTRNS